MPSSHHERVFECQLTWTGGAVRAPNEEQARHLHKHAHQGCFIANAVNFPVGNHPSIVVES